MLCYELTDYSALHDYLTYTVSTDILKSRKKVRKMVNPAFHFNFEKLQKLLHSLYLITGRKFTLMDSEFHDVIASDILCPFCKLIQNTPHGYELCRQCDKQALTHARQTNSAYLYRCHAGLVEAAIPVMGRGQTMAYLMYGQVLDDSPRQKQWEHIEQSCQWHADLPGLRHAFDELDQLDQSLLYAYADVLSACASYIWMREYVKHSELSEADLLLTYVDKNYAKPLSLKTISSELGIGRTSLCQSARASFQCSVQQLIRKKRIAEAAVLLANTKLPVGQIAEMVGYDTSSYFVKVFKASTQYTPTQFRQIVATRPALLQELQSWSERNEY